MPLRRRALAFVLGIPLLVSGCGWTPLYADTEAGPAGADLRAIRVDPINNRPGQRLELYLRDALNPTGTAGATRYELKTSLAVSRADLGIQTQGLATRGKIDGFATVVLAEIATGKVLLKTTAHSADSFDVLPNGYATVVADNDARTRVVQELGRDIVTRLTLFMQRRIAAGAKPG